MGELCAAARLITADGLCKVAVFALFWALGVDLAVIQLDEMSCMVSFVELLPAGQPADASTELISPPVMSLNSSFSPESDRAPV